MKLLGQLQKQPPKTNNPPVIAKTISCLVIIPTAPNDPPRERDPVSPIKILAGGALNHKKPRQAPIIAPQKLKPHLPLEYKEFVNNLKKQYFLKHNLLMQNMTLQE